VTPAEARARARRGDGDLLRAEILSATRHLLAETGDEDQVSIRAVCNSVGVTPPSIYLHFADKDALIYAVCSDAFAAFDEVLEACDERTDDPLEALQLRGHAYVQFGVEHPEEYRILFMNKQARSKEHTTELVAGMIAFNHLVEAVRRAADAGAIRPVDPVLAATGIWTAMHGMTSLLISMPAFPWPDVETLVDHVCATQLRGLTEGHS
jgi:AcrR family transcriptional regulator